MLHPKLDRYLTDIEYLINQMQDLYVENYQEEILTPQRCNLRIRIRFIVGHLLALNEAIVIVDSNLKFLDYRYHFQDGSNQLIFRYDNTPHFPNLPTAPHHKHLPEGAIASHKPTIATVFEEVRSIL
ncbi:DUF6516 family protein [Spirulina major CS-329]|jgi:hypothetical protein|uniref:toxin TumE n=1 Tax=Spirulina TaxID=1154 RepID=UPI00232FD056|nr:MULTISPECIES: DUF6516 family protein [Spirulina]MDB9494595.1 DUF6516 family protein [Spirulina subsalsa CS-330]MDB9504845.1 DUF6516 family protein [Spirulina major CS-329]